MHGVCGQLDEVETKEVDEEDGLERIFVPATKDRRLPVGKRAKVLAVFCSKILGMHFLQEVFLRGGLEARMVPIKEMVDVGQLSQPPKASHNCFPKFVSPVSVDVMALRTV